MTINIRPACPADTEALLGIYRYYVEHTAISFECVTPTAEEFRARVENTLKRYPYLIAERDGCAVGYAYAGPFRPRAAYDHCCELSIYVARDERRSGIGRRLYEEMESRLRALGLELSYACIGLPVTPDEYLDTASRDFHARMGYREVGRFHACGKKFGRYYDMIYMEKRLDED